MSYLMVIIMSDYFQNFSLKEAWYFAFHFRNLNYSIQLKTRFLYMNVSRLDSYYGSVKGVHDLALRLQGEDVVPFALK